MSSNGRFIYRGLNSDLNANRRTFKREKKAYENDQVITSDADFEDAEKLYEKVLTTIDVLVSLIQELALGIDSAGADFSTVATVDDIDVGHVMNTDFSRSFLNSILTKINTAFTSLDNDLRKLTPLLNNLQKLQIGELQTKRDDLENAFVSADEEIRKVRLTRFGSDQLKYQKAFGELDNRAVKVLGIFDTMIAQYSPVAIPTPNPQSVSGGYMLRPYMSNHKFI
jgi:hypothetical protein